MNISVFGLGVVGSTMAKCLHENHNVIGVDIDQKKLDAYHFYSTASVELAVKHSDLAFVCVGTPVNTNGRVDLTALITVCKDIYKAVNKPYLVVIRSTVPPGTTENILTPLLEGIEVCYYPEFLRAAHAEEDFMNPEITVIGSPNGSIHTPEELKNIVKDLPGSKIYTTIVTAELIKLACNAFHALKVVFSNELATLGKEIGANTSLVAQTLCLDTKLNISKAYMQPGNPYGGACLPKDMQMLEYVIDSAGLNLPVLTSIESSNNRKNQ